MTNFQKPVTKGNKVLHTMFLTKHFYKGCGMSYQHINSYNTNNTII